MILCEFYFKARLIFSELTKTFINIYLSLNIIMIKKRYFLVVLVVFIALFYIVSAVSACEDPDGTLPGVPQHDWSLLLKSTSIDNNGVEHTDMCLGEGDKLREFYCGGDSLQYKDISCSSLIGEGSICSQGQCTCPLSSCEYDNDCAYDGYSWCGANCARNTDGMEINGHDCIGGISMDDCGGDHCNDKCVGNTRYYNGRCNTNTGECEYDTETCDYGCNVDTGECLEEESSSCESGFMQGSIYYPGYCPCDHPASGPLISDQRNLDSCQIVGSWVCESAERGHKFIKNDIYGSNNIINSLKNISELSVTYFPVLAQQPQHSQQPQEQEQLPQTLPLYGLVGREEGLGHYVTTDYNDYKAKVGTVASHGEYLLGVIPGYVYKEQQPDTIPLYRVYNPTTHDYRVVGKSYNQVLGQGYQEDALLGYVYANQAPHTKPIYLMYNDETKDSTIQTTDNERIIAQQMGYNYLSIEGYVLESPNSDIQYIRIYRFYNPDAVDHMLGGEQEKQYLEQINSVYHPEGYMYILSGPTAGTVPLYRMYYDGTAEYSWKDKDHVCLSDVADWYDYYTNGWRYEGVLGYIYKTQKPGTVPIYLLNRPNSDSFCTISSEEATVAVQQYGYENKGVLGYAYLSPPSSDSSSSSVSEVTGFTKTGCCPRKFCWTGEECVDSSGWFNKPQEGPFFDSEDGCGYRCIADPENPDSVGEWVLTCKKFDWFGELSGYCNYHSQCLVSPSTQPYCIDSGDYIEDVGRTPREGGNHFCLGGTWTTRSVMMAVKMLDFVAKENVESFSIYCDTLENISNVMDIPTDIKYGCILQYFTPLNERHVLLGLALEGTSPEDVAAMLGYACDTSDLDEEEKTRYVECPSSNGRIWYNYDSNTVIYSRDNPEQLEPNNWWDNFIDLLYNPLVKLMHYFAGFFSTQINMQNYENIISSGSDIDKLFLQYYEGKSIVAYIDHKWDDNPLQHRVKDFMFINYTGFHDEVCVSVNHSLNQPGFIGYQLFGPNVLPTTSTKCFKIGTGYFVYDMDDENSEFTRFWRYLTSGTRIHHELLTWISQHT